jgi:Xaa-Pro aminopeptidase
LVIEGILMFAVRRDRLLLQLRREGLDAALITQPVNVSYLTGFSGDTSCLIIGPKKTILVSDGRFTDQIAEECPGLETIIRPPVQPLGEAAAAALNKLGCGTVGYESGHLTVAEFEALAALTKTLQWKPALDRVERLRMIKDAEEIQQIRQAIRWAEKAFVMFRAMLRPDDTEKELADNLEHFVRLSGAKGTAFPSIVAVGPRAALPHAPPTSKRVREAALLLVDWGAGGPFYKSDLTRVLLTRDNSPSGGRLGEPQGESLSGSDRELDARVKEIYAIVLRAQLAAIAALRPGVRAREVDAAARTVIAEAGYGEYFTHSIGHGIGMMVHEAPIMRANTETVLEAGMVVTIEPGIYLPGVAGVRIEDDVLVTPEGREVLTSLPKTFDAAIQTL